MRWIFLLALVGLLSAACAAEPDTAATTTSAPQPPTTVQLDVGLQETGWTLRTYGREAQPQSASDESPTTIRFDDGEVSGRAPCNNFSGEYQIRGDEIIVDIQAVTRMACVDPALTELEQTFFEALRNAQRFDVIGDRMKIEYGQGLSLVFDAG